MSVREGEIIREIKNLKNLKIDISFLKTASNMKNIKAFQVSEDNIEPTIKNEYFIIIDTKIINSANDIYVIAYKNNFYHRRNFNFNGTINIILDNKKYPVQKYNPKESDLYFRIIGKKVLMINK